MGGLGFIFSAIVQNIIMAYSQSQLELALTWSINAVNTDTNLLVLHTETHSGLVF